MGRLKLANRIVWITGASSGIGEEMAYICAMKGARVILSSSNYTKLEKAWLKSRELTKESYMALLDLGSPADFPDIVERLVEKHGVPDIMINNGGISQRSATLETSEEVLRKLMEIDFFGPALLTKAMLPKMIENGGGQIAVTSSITGYFGTPLRSGYAAAKHALHGYFETIRAEHHKDNIGVTIAVPGRINTPISQSALTGDGGYHGKKDPGLAKGMSARDCALKYIKAVEKRKPEVLIGKGETLTVPIKRFWPGLSRLIMRKVKPV